MVVIILKLLVEKLWSVVVFENLIISCGNDRLLLALFDTSSNLFGRNLEAILGVLGLDTVQRFLGSLITCERVSHLYNLFLVADSSCVAFISRDKNLFARWKIVFLRCGAQSSRIIRHGCSLERWYLGCCLKRGHQ